jgi:hypothetical protein
MWEKSAATPDIEQTKVSDFRVALRQQREGIDLSRDKRVLVDLVTLTPSKCLFVPLQA